MTAFSICTHFSIQILVTIIILIPRLYSKYVYTARLHRQEFHSKLYFPKKEMLSNIQFNKMYHQQRQ